LVGEKNFNLLTLSVNSIINKTTANM